MVLKCCVPNCKSSYASKNDKVPVYKLPQNNEDKKKWIAAIPRANLVVLKYTAVCSNVNDVAISPRPIECHSVSMCQRIFCDETIAAWESHPKINNEAASGTVNFLYIVLKLWKIFNVKNPRENQAHNDAIRAVIKIA